MSIKGYKVFDPGLTDTFADDAISGVTIASDTASVDTAASPTFDAAPPATIAPFGEVLGTVSDVVELTSTIMSMTGSIPGLSSIFGGGGPDWGAIEEKVNDIDNKMSEMLKIGNDLKTALGDVNDRIDASFLAGVQAHVLNARGDLSNYLAATTTHDQTTYRDGALSESQSAINLVTNYFQAGGTDASDPGKDIGVILGAALMRIAAVEQFDDGAFAKDAYKPELNAAANLLDQSADALAAQILTRETVTSPQGGDATFTNAAGTVPAYHLSVETAASSDAYNSGGIMGLLAKYKSIEISFSGYPDPAALAEVKHAIDVIQDGIAEDVQTFQLAVFHATAAGWRTLVAGQYLTGSDAHDDVIDNSGSGTRDTLSGLAGNDILTGGSQDNALLGGDGNDVITGNGGTDRIEGGAGNDLLRGGDGDDWMDGGAGNDTASYDDVFFPGVHVDLNQTVAQDTGGGGLDTLTNIENVIGSWLDDVLIGNSGANVLDGRDGINTLQGNGGNDTLIGGIQGQDTLEGGDGDDLMIAAGPGGAAFMLGGAGNDTASFAGIGGSLVLQLAGAQQSQFSLPNFWTGTIADVENVIGGTASDTIGGDGRANTLTGSAGDDQLSGGGGNDTLYGDDQSKTNVDGADTLSGGTGDDIFARTSAGAGVDTLTGGTGRDTYQLAWKASAAADVVTDFAAGAGGDFIDISVFKKDAVDGFTSGFLRVVQIGDDAVLQSKVSGTYQNVLVLHDTLASSLVAGNFTAPNGGFKPITGGPTNGNDTLTGTGNADAISGFDGNDTLNGGGNSDVLKGENGNDHLNGGTGDDMLDGGPGKDTIVGGAGSDTVTYAALSADIQVALNGNTAVDVFVRNGGGTLVAEDKLSQVENVVGGSGNDQLTGDALANRLSGGAGADTLSGGDGNDVLDGGDGIDTATYTPATQHVVVSLAIGGAQNTIGAGHDTLIGIENLTGSAFNDTLTGNDGANTLGGGAGDDVLDGGLGADVLIGGTGIDTVNYASETRAIQLTLNGDTPASVSFSTGGAFAAEDNISGIENVTAGAGDDQITGDTLANVLIGGGGADVLNGAGGNDVLYGDDKSSATDGADTLIGGGGADVFMRVSAGNGVDHLTGGTGSDSYKLNFANGNAADVVTDFAGGTGGDIIDLSAFGAKAHNGFTSGYLRVVQQGVDVAIQVETHAGDSSAYQTALLLANFSASALTAANFSAGSGFVPGSALFIGTGGDDVMTGTTGGETIDGRGGDDIIRGGGGNDTIIGGAGFDIADYRDKSAAVVVTLSGDTPTSVHVGSHAEDTVAGIEAIYGGSGADVLTGDGLDNLFRGGGGHDTLDGGAGTDTADYSDKSAAISVTLNGATAATVTVGAQAEDTLVNIENVYGGAGADHLTGDKNDNLFRGGAGRDVINGGGGFDIADYSDKTAAVSVTLDGSNVATVSVGGAAEDKIHNIEGIIGGAGNDALTGDAKVNQLYGGDGDDTLASGGGKDLLDGGAGHDTADYSAEAAAITLALNGGSDARVHIGGVADALLRNVEEVHAGSGDDVLSGRGGVVLDGGSGTNLLDYSATNAAVHVTLGGASDGQVWFGNTFAATVRDFQNVDGGSGADFLGGDGAVNTLDGNAGDDTLSSGGGNDVLDGGEGNDVADFSYTSATVSVSALSSSSDTTVFVGDLGGINTIDMVTLKNVEGIIGGSGDDSLTGDDTGHLLGGGDGNDFLTGGAGHDTLIGGAGLDVMTGGGGADTFVFSQADMDAKDVIDFNPDDGDKIDLHAFGLTSAPDVTVGQDDFGSPCLFVDLHHDGSQVLAIDLTSPINGDPTSWDTSSWVLL